MKTFNGIFAAAATSAALLGAAPAVDAQPVRIYVEPPLAYEFDRSAGVCFEETRIISHRGQLTQIPTGRVVCEAPVVVAPPVYPLYGPRYYAPPVYNYGRGYNFDRGHYNNHGRDHGPHRH